MAKVFYFSKKFSQQGAPIREVSANDLITVSKPVAVTPLYKLGFRTHGATLNQLKDYMVKELKTFNLAWYINSKGGIDHEYLLGNGTEDAPLHVYQAGIERKYNRNVDFPFTQVGDPSDFTLPISGSYLSVSYPYQGDPMPSSMFVEGNGDLRILNHVTNGEKIGPVYAIWKNYRNTAMSTMLKTDVLYQPPGLAVDEFIHNVYPASDTAMIAEIHNASGFKEHCFVILNDTFSAEYHKLIRLGTQLLTVLYEMNISTVANRNTALRVCRAAMPMAAIVKEKMYIGSIRPPSTAAPGAILQFSFTELSANGVVTKIRGWRATNPQGLVYTGDNADIYKKLSTNTETDKEGMYVIKNPAITANTYLGSTGVSAFNRATWTTTGDGRMVIMSRHYGSWYGPLTYGAIKYLHYFIVNFDNKTVVPEPTTGFNRRTVMDLNENNSPYYVYQSMNYENGHYGAGGTHYQLLPTGDRIFQYFSGQLDINHYIRLYRGDAVDALQGASDNYFRNQRSWTEYPRPAPPTAIISGSQATIVYDTMVQIDAKFLSGYTTGGNYARLIGSPTAKNYELINGDTTTGTTQTIPGYHLNNERGDILTGETLNINSFRINGNVYYHNAMWSPTTPVSKEFSARLNRNIESLAKFKTTQTVYDRMEQLVQDIVKPPNFSEVFSYEWSIVPPHPDTNYNYAQFKVLVSWRELVDASKGVHGYNYTGLHLLTGIVPATVTRDASGDYTLTDINFATIDKNAVRSTGSSRINRYNSYMRGASVLDIGATEVMGINRGGGTAVSYIGTYSNHDAWRIHSFKCNRQGLNRTMYPNKPGYTEQPCISPTLGIGMVNYTYGMGCFYAFIPVNTQTMAQEPSNARILGTARPAAGFSITISAPIDVYIEGRNATIPVQTIDLTKLTSAYRNTTFYCYATVFNNKADILITKTILEEQLNQVFIGTIKTTYTEISEIDCKPVTRWELGRPSVYPMGSAIPVSTGLPTDTDVRVWENATTGGDISKEYLWGEDDINDTGGLENVQLTITGAPDTIYVTNNYQLNVAVRGLTVPITSTTWSVSSTTIATIGSSGYLTTKSPGELTITVTVNARYTASKKVYVEAPYFNITGEVNPIAQRQYTYRLISEVPEFVVNTVTWGIVASHGSLRDGTTPMEVVFSGEVPRTTTITATVNGKYATNFAVNIISPPAAEVSITTTLRGVNAYDYFVSIMGRAPNVGEDVIITVEEDVYLIGNSTIPEGIVFDDRFNSVNNITLVNKGFIFGLGGKGGDASKLTENGLGGNGSNAILNSGSRTVNVTNQGFIAGGGGGGAGGYGGKITLLDSGAGGGGAPYGVGGGGGGYTGSPGGLLVGGNGSTRGGKGGDVGRPGARSNESIGGLAGGLAGAISKGPVVITNGTGGSVLGRPAIA